MIGFPERGNNMTTWADYKNKIRTSNNELAEDVDEIEKISKIVGAMISQRLKFI